VSAISRIGGDWVSIGLVINLTVSLSVRMNGAWRKREHVAAWRNTRHRLSST
jgi:hypothetical protein